MSVGEITAPQIAWCAGVEYARYRSWGRAGLLKYDAPFTEHDAVAAAIAFSLARQGVSQKAARAAWPNIGRQVRELLIRGECEMWVVIGVTGRASVVARAAAVAAEAARSGRCWVVNVADDAERARLRYAECVSSPTGVARVSVLPVRAATSDRGPTLYAPN